ncbi:glycoside hydrolase family 2 TIM barrel-domain containing protein [Mucilaginibacter sp. PAMB04274]|uniref:glycoside hydrolase family 2 protein n=1 Tax=Mucilaginibacter sp. PAMB04274 TaxID=3138568 RepID=UPI0031F6CDEA
MNKYIIGLLLWVSASGHLKAQQKPVDQNFSSNWEFVKDIDTTNAAKLLSQPTGSTIAWAKISLPHTPRLEAVKKVEEQWQGTCFYRKFFSLLPTNKNKRIAIRFDAAMHEADVYLNGKKIISHVGGYLPFTIDIADKVFFDKPNCILVKLNNQDNAAIPPGKPIKDLDFNYYGGIYRNAWLMVQDKLYISDAVQENLEARGGIMVHTDEANNSKAVITVKTDVRNQYADQQRAGVKISLLSADGKIVSTAQSNEQAVKAGGLQGFAQTLTVSKPYLWSTENPYLYRLKVQVLRGNVVVDEQIIRSGIRTIRFDAAGFYLNERKTFLNGTNRHQEYPLLGYALSDNMQYRDAWKIKDAGFNFVRCSHYPPAPSFLDACDELGILVMDAIPGWQFFGKEDFQKNSLQDIRDMIRRDRNHSSIVLWEASLNETNMAKAYMDTANSIAHRELPYKDTYTSGWMDYAYDVFNPARQHAKAPNYWKKYNKTKPLLIAEYGDWEYYAQNAGFNQKAYEGLKKEERNSRQLRTDGQQRLLQQALNYQESHNDNKYGNAIGDANWLMFDYKRGYASDIESSGVMDIYRLPKFSFYFYQSQYGPVADSKGFGKPMIYIANYWNDAGQKSVKVFSNCEQVELFLNGRSLGRQKPDTGALSSNLKHPPFTFNVKTYQPGTLKAVGYIGNKQSAVSTQSTPGKPYQIVIKADESGKKWTAGTNDALLFYAYVTDRNGTLIPGASHLVNFITSGNAEVIGTNKVAAEAGIAAVLIKAGSKGGTVVVKATGAGLKSAVFNTITK